MSLPIISRRFEFDAGHRLIKHGGKCQNYHGHRYVVELYLKAPTINVEQGMFIDFSEVKRRVGGWLDTYWDHGMILQRGDPMIEFLYEQEHKGFEMFEKEVFIDRPKVYIIEEPPTVENLIRIFARVAQLELDADGGTSLRIAKVDMWETPNCKAEYVPWGS